MPQRDRKDAWAVDFGAYIRRLRIERHWPIAEVARRMEHTAAWVGILEKGGNMPSVTALNWLATAFGMRASELLRGFEDEQIARRAASRDSSPGAGS